MTNFLANLDRLIDRFDRPLAAGEAPLRASLLRQVLIGAALACGAYTRCLALSFTEAAGSFLGT